MKTQHLNFTEKGIAAITPPKKEDGQLVCYDDGTSNGLILIVTYGGSKTYYFYMYLKGKPIRVKIGKSPIIKLAEARQKAAILRAKAEQGEDPSQKRHYEQKDITLKRFYDDVYRPKHSEVYKRPKSIAKDDSMFKLYLEPLHNRKMLTITRTDLEEMHKALKNRISPYTANRTLTLIKHMYTKAYEWGFPKEYENPAIGIKMFAEKSRDRFLQSDELERFFTELNQEPNIGFRNFILLSLFVGQRKNNMLAVKWSDIDLENGFIHFADTKNGEAQHIPLTKYAQELLFEMKKTADNTFLFPSSTSKSGHIEDFHRPWYALLKRANIADFRFHDIRRTFGSYQAISGASLQIIGKSLGHKSSGATAVYSRLSIDPIRESMERATAKMLELAE